MIIIMWQDFSIFQNKTALRFDRGDVIFRSDSKVAKIFLVSTGQAALIRTLMSGQQAILQRASTGQIIAEASLYVQRYHCDCVAMEPTELVSIPRQEFLDALRSDPQLSEAWASYLAHGVQQARLRAEIRSMKTVSERLDAWIAEYHEIPVKGKWQDLADELSVSREALYRELAKRRVL